MQDKLPVPYRGLRGPVWSSLWPPALLFPSLNPWPSYAPSSCLPGYSHTSCSLRRAHARSMNILPLLIIQVSAQCHLLREALPNHSGEVPPPQTLQTLSVLFFSSIAFITIWNDLIYPSIYLLDKFGSSTYNNCRAAHRRLTLQQITITNSGEYLKDNAQKSLRVTANRKKLIGSWYSEEGKRFPIFMVFTWR